MAKDRDIVPFGDKLPENMTFQDLMDAGVIDISEVDDRYQVDQEELVGVPFILVDWEIKTSDRITRNGEPTSYAFCEVRTENQGLCVFADGGSGIMDQLERYKERMGTLVTGNARLYFHYGLRVSEYQYTDPETGDKSPARTYYFDNRPRP